MSQKFANTTLDTVANTLRSLQDFKTLEAVFIPHERRVEVFHGQELLEHLQKVHNSKGAKRNPDLTSLEGKTKDELVQFSNALLQTGKYFAPVVRADKSSDWIPKNGRPVTVKHDTSATQFSDQGFYMWLIEPSQTTALLKALGLIAAILAVTCIRIWPLWLRIGLFWISVFILSAMLLMHVLHASSYIIFYIIGFRGVYFLPNLYDDDVGILESFSPLFGRGGEHQARWHYEELVLRARIEGRPIPPEVVQPSIWTNWKFTTIQAAAILILCFVVCNFLGLFKPENVPAFVMSPREMYSMFPSLTPPDWVDDEEIVAKKAQEAKAEGY